jgi:predicted transcriptional regulator
MGRRNLTVQLDDDVVRKARVLAAQRSTSISGLIRTEIERLVGEADAYAAAQGRARARLRRGLEFGGPPYPQREELHDRA